MQTPKQFFWWMVALSIGLHAAGSWVPWMPFAQLSPEKDGDVPLSANGVSDEELPETEAAAIALVQLPSSAPPKQSVAVPAIDAEIAAEVVSEPALPETFDPVEPVEDFVETENLLDAEAANADNVQALNQADPLEDNSKPAKTETSSQLETSQVTDDESTSDESTNDATTNGVLVALADFPHLSGAQPGCFGLSQCHQSQGNYRDVGEQLTEQMRQQGYQLTPQDDIDEPGHRVFEVVNPAEPEQIYYLNVFSDGLDSAVYALTLDILSLEELKDLNA